MAIDSQMTDKGVLQFKNDLDQVIDGIIGGPGSPSVSSPRFYSDALAKMPMAAGVDTGGGIVAWQNPFNYSLIVQGLILDVTTGSTNATATVISGVVANATATGTTLLTAQAINATGTFNGGFKSVKMTTGQWVTVSIGTGASTGLVGNVYINFSPA